MNIFMLAAEKSKDTFIAPIGIGLTLFICEIAGVFYTGASLNPARSFGPCVAGRNFQGYHWIYWIVSGQPEASDFSFEADLRPRDPASVPSLHQATTTSSNSSITRMRILARTRLEANSTIRQSISGAAKNFLEADNTRVVAATSQDTDY